MSSTPEAAAPPHPMQNPTAKVTALERWARRAEAPIFPLLVLSVATLPFLFTMWPAPSGSKTLYRAPILLGIVLSALARVLRTVDASPWPRHWRWMSAVAFVLRVTLLGAIIIGALLLAAGHYSNLRLMPGYQDYSSGEMRDIVWFAFAKSHSLTLLVFYCLILDSPRRGELLAEGMNLYLLTGLRLVMAGMFLFALASALLSHDPYNSLIDFRDDLGGSTLAMLLLLRTATRPGHIRTLLIAAALAGLYAALVNGAWLALFKWGTPELRTYAVDNELVYCTEWTNHRDWMPLEQMDLRPCYPLKHHNRLANYMMMLVGIGGLLVAWPGQHRRARAGWLLCTSFYFAMLILTNGRGAWLSLMAGIMAALALFYRPWRGWRHNAAAGAVVLGMLASWWALPATHRQHIRELFDISGDPAQMSGNVLRRVHSIRTALEMRERFPTSGIGYGHHVFEELYAYFEPKRFYVELQASELIQPHAHMNILQVAAEQGDWAVMLFVLHVLFTVGLLLFATSRARRAGSPMAMPLRCMTALVLMMQFYGLTNYSLRYSLGLFYFLLMTMAAVLAFSWYRDEQPFLERR